MVYGICWMWPPPSNSGILSGLQESSTKNTTILVVTVTGRGQHPRYMAYDQILQIGQVFSGATQQCRTADAGPRPFTAPRVGGARGESLHRGCLNIR